MKLFLLKVKDLTLDDLDKLAAEKVMGWILCDDKDDEEHYCMWLESNGHPTFWYEGTSGTDDLWMPTRNIAQAWELLERLYHLTPFIYKRWGNWFAGFDLHTESIEAPMAPEAIVRACLLAVGIDPDQATKSVEDRTQG